ncbi:MAG: hypothetical protein WC400_03255 [Patescibacteria group bacterium]|jgi:hypothetical protein
MSKWILPVILLVVVGVGLWWVNDHNPSLTNNVVNNTETPIVNDNPVVPASDEACVGMSWADAQKIAGQTEWADQLTDDRVCNEFTKTWWIDLSLKQAGCSPALVIHTDTGSADINWRCTGAIPSVTPLVESFTKN